MPSIRSILIALPTVSRAMKIETTIAIAQTVKALESAGIDTSLHNIDSAEIVTARDMFANILLHSSKWDALLFIDSDMGFEPRLVLRMAKLGADVAAAACPRRNLNEERLISAIKEHGDMSRARAEASTFTVNFDWDGKRRRPAEVKGGFCRAAAVGMAIALISKNALQAMVDAKVVEPRLDLNATGGATCWSFFGNVENNGHRLGEDYSFCYRWTKLMGRELFVCVDEEIKHVGEWNYRARYADLF